MSSPEDGAAVEPLNIFYSYSHQDEKLRAKLETHLALLRRQGLISDWHDRKIVAGAPWADEIDSHLENSQIVLLLISPDFLQSDYCYGKEMGRALAMHEAGKARVIPILLRPVDWTGAPFGHLQAVPKDAKPVTSWHNRDEAWRDVARGIRLAVNERKSSTRLVRSPRGDTVRSRSQQLSDPDEFLVPEEYPVTGGKVHGPPFDNVLLTAAEPFIGRAVEIQRLFDRLSSTAPNVAVAAIHGLSGIGKTALAAEVVWRLHEVNAFPDGIAVINCREEANAIALARMAMSRFDPYRRKPDVSDLTTLADEAHGLLENKRTLIIFDGLRPEIDLSDVVPLLRRCGSSLLLISQQMLPLNVVSADARVILDSLTLDEATELFVRSAGVPISERNESGVDANAHIEEIVSALGQHPLAIRLVAGYAADLQSDLASLASELRSLRTSPTALGSWQLRMLRTILDDVISTLPPDMRRLFAVIPAFGTLEVGRWAVESLAANLSISDPERAVNSLVMRTLLKPLLYNGMPTSSDRQRLRVHTLVWAFALEQWEKMEPDAREAARLAVAKFYSAYIAGTDEGRVKRINVNTFDEWEAAIGPDAENIEFTLDRYLLSSDHGGIDQAELDSMVFGLWSGMQYYWRSAGQEDKILRYGAAGITSASRLVEKEPDNGELRLFASRQAIVYARALRNTGQLDEAESIFLTNLEVRRELHDEVGESAILENLALLENYRGEVDHEEKWLQESLAIISRLQHPADEVSVLVGLGKLEINRSNMDVADKYLRRALALANEATLRQEKIPILIQMGRLATFQNQPANARVLFG